MADSTERFVALLRKTSGLEATIDRPDDPLGESFIDIAGQGVEMQVSYRPSVGFGFFTESDTFGQRPDILIKDPSEAVRHFIRNTHKNSKQNSASKTKKTKKPMTVVTRTEIGDHLAATFDIPKSHAQIYLTEAVSLVAKHLRTGSKVRIAGLGVFQVKRRNARIGRNPNTGEQIKIKASKRVGFAASRDLKENL